jgi:uncharacterized membrane protein
MYVAFAIVGFIIGGMLAGGGSASPLGAVGGALLGVLWAYVRKLEQRIGQLEATAGTRRPRSESPEPQKRRPAFEAPLPASPDPEDPRPEDLGPKDTGSPPFPAINPDTPWEPPVPASLNFRWPLGQTLLSKALTWLTTGNIPAKVGVTLSFVGVSFLLKYAVDHKLVVMPLELRLLAVAIAAMIMLIIGWRLREKTRVYALSLQGGGLGILFLTIFAALRIWGLLPAPLAFALLLALTACTGALSVLQNSRSLAIFGIVGGFLAPVLTSTGQGSHVALFSYYLLLNGAILGIAWFKAWRVLNLIGFVFTFLIGSVWGYQYYKPEFLFSTEPFLILHFLFYQAIAILYALRQPPERLGIVDGTLVFGTPVIVFALQAALVRDTQFGLAISAAAAAVFYVLIAMGLFRRKSADLKLMTESFLALAVAFATITIPLALDARWTSAAWALEGAALVWVGMRQGRHLAKLAGAGLILASGVAFMESGWIRSAGLPVLNGNVLGGLLISLSAFFASRKLESGHEGPLALAHRYATLALFAWAVLWWLGVGWMETGDRLTISRQVPVFLIVLSLSVGLALWLGRARRWDLLRRSALLLLPMMVLMAIFDQGQQQHFLLGPGWLAWPLAGLVQAAVLRVMDEYDDPLAPAWHFATLCVYSVLLALEAFWWTSEVASTAWASCAASAVAGVMALLVWRFRKQPAWPVPFHPFVYLLASVLLVSAQILYVIALSIGLPGDPHPWPYIPVINPFDLAMLFAMTTALLSRAVISRDYQANLLDPDLRLVPVFRRFILASFFLLTTLALVRAVHHFAAVPWSEGALFDSVVVQTSLSIYWGLLGFIGMIWGARSARRPLWLAGAGFMGLVVIKLFLIDLGNSGTVARIVSFIGIGALLLVVGYFAPAPPRRSSGKDTPGGAEGRSS